MAKQLTKKALLDMRNALIQRSAEYIKSGIAIDGASAIRAYLTADHHSWTYEQWEEQQVLWHYYFDQVTLEDRAALHTEIESAVYVYDT